MSSVAEITGTGHEVLHGRPRRVSPFFVPKALSNMAAGMHRGFTTYSTDHYLSLIQHADFPASVSCVASHLTLTSNKANWLFGVTRLPVS
jgi:hypothetical protein